MLFFRFSFFRNCLGISYTGLYQKIWISGSEKMLHWAKKMHMRPAKKRKLFSDGAENKQQFFFYTRGGNHAPRTRMGKIHALRMRMNLDRRRSLKNNMYA